MLLFCSLLHGQQCYKFKQYNLPYINTIHQSADGYIWLGGDEGLQQFDGNRFYNFNQIEDPKYKPSDKRIWKLLSDKKNNLWMCTQSGVYYYNSQTHLVTNCHLPDSQPFFSMFAAINLQGNAMFATYRNGLLVSDTNNNLRPITHVLNDTNHLTSQMVALHQTTNGLWLATAKGKFYLLRQANDTAVKSLDVVWVDKPKHVFIQHVVYNSLAKTWMLSVALDSLVTKTAIYEAKFSDNKVFIQQLKLPKSCNYVVKHLAFDNAHNLWLCFVNRLPVKLTLNVSNGNSTIIHDDPLLCYNSEEVKITNVNATYCDLYNRLWCISDDKIFMTSLNNQNTQAPIGIKSMPDINAYNHADALHQTDSGIYLTMPGDTIIYAGFNGTSKKISFRYNDGLSIFSLKTDYNNDMYLATFNGVKHIPQKYISDKFNIVDTTAFKNNPIQALIDNVINTKMSTCIYKAADSSLFFGCFNGLYKLNKNRTHISTIKYNKANLPTVEMVNFNNAYYVAAEAGVYTLNFNDTVAQPCTNNALAALQNQQVACLTVSNNQLWIGTYKGLYVYTVSNTADTLIKLNDFEIRGAVTDAYKNVWIAAQNVGMLFYPFGKLKSVLINDDNDLLSNSFTYGGGKFANLPNGNLLVLTENGFNCINPKQWPQNIILPNLKVSETEINYIPILSNPTQQFKDIRSSIFQHQIIKVPYYQNTINLKFASLHGNATHAITYYARLFGFDKNWVNAQPNEVISYRELPPFRASYFFPGTYIFQVKTITEAGQIHIHPLLQITIGTNFWRSYEFFAIAFIILLVLLIYIIRYFAQLRLREKLREQEKLLAIERERNRISEDLHDDLGAGLSSIAMMTGVMRELITDEDSKNTADEVSTEANELVARMREIIWSMNSKNDTVENMLTYINDYCHRYLAKNKIEIRMQMPEYVPDINITSEARENTFLVIKETLHNAVKHAQSGKFSFQATLDTHWLTIKLNDHGKGFDLNAINRFGNGMLNMEQRIHKISGKFLITSEPGQGTQTHIEIPIS